MKIFDFTNGVKGRQLGSTKVMNSSAGWLVSKDGKVYKIELKDPPLGWSWTTGATWLLWKKGGETEDIPIRPEDFGVEAICFCWGQEQKSKIWNWYVIGTEAWNREACHNGILKYTYSHTMKEKA